MRTIRTKNRVVILAFLIVVAGAVLLIFRPEFVSYESFHAGIEKIKQYVPGQSDGKKATAKSPFGNKPAANDQLPVKKDIYRIELKSGGRVYTDNLKTGDGKLTYVTNKGLVITLNSYEVIGVQTFKEGEEPED